MKAKLIPGIICICMLAFLTNCTIEKRLFQKGYHIEWKKKAAHDQTSDEFNKLNLASDNTPKKQTPETAFSADQQTESNSITEKNTSEAAVVSSDTKTTDEPTVLAPKTDPTESASVKKETESTLQNTTDDEEMPPPTDQKLFEPVGIVSFSFYFLGFVLGLLAIVAANPVAVLGFTALILLVALILGIISVVRYHRNRELYRYNFFGYFGLIASAATLIFGLIALTLYAILLLSSWPG